MERFLHHVLQASWRSRSAHVSLPCWVRRVVSWGFQKLRSHAKFGCNFFCVVVRVFPINTLIFHRFHIFFSIFTISTSWPWPRPHLNVYKWPSEHLKNGHQNILTMPVVQSCPNQKILFRQSDRWATWCPSMPRRSEPGTWRGGLGQKRCARWQMTSARDLAEGHGWLW